MGQNRSTFERRLELHLEPHQQGLIATALRDLIMATGVANESLAHSGPELLLLAQDATTHVRSLTEWAREPYILQPGVLYDRWDRDEWTALEAVWETAEQADDHLATLSARPDIWRNPRAVVRKVGPWRAR